MIFLEGSATALSDFLGNVSSIVTSALSWSGQVWDFIVGKPVLMCICLGIPLVGLGVSYLARLIRV